MSSGIVVVNMNGVLLDTEAVLYESWSRVYRIFGYRMNPGYWTSVIRPDRPDAAAYYSLCHYMRDPPSAESAISLQRHFARELISDARPRPGVAEFIDHCRQGGLSAVLVTSAPEEIAVATLRRFGIGSLFDHTLSLRNLHGEPHLMSPVFSKFINFLSGSRETIISVEASPETVDSARRRGCLAVAYPNYFMQQMDFSSADIIVEGNKLIDIVNQILRSGPRKYGNRLFRTEYRINKSPEIELGIN